MAIKVLILLAIIWIPEFLQAQTLDIASEPRVLVQLNGYLSEVVPGDHWDSRIDLNLEEYRRIPLLGARVELLDVRGVVVDTATPLALPWSLVEGEVFTYPPGSYLIDSPPRSVRTLRVSADSYETLTVPFDSSHFQTSSSWKQLDPDQPLVPGPRNYQPASDMGLEGRRSHVVLSLGREGDLWMNSDDQGCRPFPRRPDLLVLDYGEPRWVYRGNGTVLGIADTVWRACATFGMIPILAGTCHEVVVAGECNTNLWEMVDSISSYLSGIGVSVRYFGNPLRVYNYGTGKFNHRIESFGGTVLLLPVESVSRREIASFLYTAGVNSLLDSSVGEPGYLRVTLPPESMGTYLDLVDLLVGSGLISDIRTKTLEKCSPEGR